MFVFKILLFVLWKDGAQQNPEQNFNVMLVRYMPSGKLGVAVELAVGCLVALGAFARFASQKSFGRDGKEVKC